MVLEVMPSGTCKTLASETRDVRNSGWLGQHSKQYYNSTNPCTMARKKAINKLNRHAILHSKAIDKNNQDYPLLTYP